MTGVTGNGWQVSVEDAAGNEAAPGGEAFVYDATAPRPVEVALANGDSSVTWTPDSGDTVTYRFDSPVDPSSLVGDWSAQPDQRFAVDWNGAVRIARGAHQPAVEFGGKTRRLTFKDTHKARPNAFAFLFGVGNARQIAQKILLGVYGN